MIQLMKHVKLAVILSCLMGYSVSHAQSNTKDTELYDTVKGLWYAETYHVHFAVPSCSCEAQLLYDNIDETTKEDHPFRYARFCVNEAGVSKSNSVYRRAATTILRTNQPTKLYTYPVMTDTSNFEETDWQERENHWIISIAEFVETLPKAIQKIAPQGIDLNFLVSWGPESDGMRNMKCLNEHSEAICNQEGMNIGNQNFTPELILVGDNPSKKSDFTMLLSRTPFPTNSEQALDTIEKIYDPATTNKKILPNMKKNMEKRTSSDGYLQCIDTLNTFVQESLYDLELSMSYDDTLMVTQQLEIWTNH